jgi:hypothetical protein
MKSKRKETNILSDISEQVADSVASFYDKKLLEILEGPCSFTPKIIRYKKVKVPRYLEITIPVIKKHYSDDWWEYEGLLLTTKRIRICRIGTKTEREPIYKKRTGTIVFKRYSKLNPKLKHLDGRLKK